MKIKVLIVEDEPITSEDIREILEEHGMVVVDTVRTGEAAIESTTVNEPDVILMDIKLEGELDGIEAVRLINQTGFFPIVYLTGNPDRLNADRAFATNPSAFLTKPFDEDDLTFAIELAFVNHSNQILEHSENPKDKEAIFLKSGIKYEKVWLKNILFFKAEGSYCNVFTPEKTYSLSSNLNQVAKKINHPDFIRIHRSYVVNINNVEGLDNSYLYFKDHHIHYSKTHRKELSNLLHRIS